MSLTSLAHTPRPWLRATLQHWPGLLTSNRILVAMAHCLWRRWSVPRSSGSAAVWETDQKGPSDKRLRCARVECLTNSNSTETIHSIPPLHATRLPVHGQSQDISSDIPNAPSDIRELNSNTRVSFPRPKASPNSS